MMTDLNININNATERKQGQIGGHLKTVVLQYTFQHREYAHTSHTLGMREDGNRKVVQIWSSFDDELPAPTYHSIQYTRSAN